MRGEGVVGGGTLADTIMIVSLKIDKDPNNPDAEPKYTASMVSIPVLLVTSMVIFPETLPNLEVNGGGGMYFMFNNVQLFGSKINSSVFSLKRA